MFSKGLVKTSIAAAELGISTVYLKNLREEYGGFLVGGEHYFLGVSQTDSIKWDVEKVAKKCTKWVALLEKAAESQKN